MKNPGKANTGIYVMSINFGEYIPGYGNTEYIYSDDLSELIEKTRAHLAKVAPAVDYELRLSYPNGPDKLRDRAALCVSSSKGETVDDFKKHFQF